MGTVLQWRRQDFFPGGQGGSRAFFAGAKNTNFGSPYLGVKEGVPTPPPPPLSIFIV